MKENTISLIKRIYSIAIVVLTIVVAILSMIQIIDIFLTGRTTGEQMYTPEIIWEHFKVIAPFLTIWIIALIFGYIFYLLYPSKDKINAKMENKALVEKLSTSLPEDLSAYQEELNIINKEKKSRFIGWIIAISIIVLLAIPCALYLFNLDHFSKDGNLMNEAGVMVLNLLPWLLFMFGTLLTIKTYVNYSYKNELIQIRKILQSSPDKKPVQIIRPKSPSKKMIMTTRIAILVVGVTFIIIGIINGGAFDVLAKAIQICTECIGLG